MTTTTGKKDKEELNLNFLPLLTLRAKVTLAGGEEEEKECCKLFCSAIAS